MRKKVLFLIHDLGPGGAEKVLVNLVNHMDAKSFDITVLALFDGGINRKFLAPHINYQFCFSKMPRGNSHMMKICSPKCLHRYLIKGTYDIEISYLEGVCARIIGGCENRETKLITWIHIEQQKRKEAASFRSKREALDCYRKFHKIVCVSEAVRESFLKCFPIDVPLEVCYNTNDSEKILKLAKEPVPKEMVLGEAFSMVGVGKLLKRKGFDRILKIAYRLKKEGYPIRIYLLGNGPKKKKLEDYVKKHQLESNVTFLGYQVNPYKYIKRSDLFVCASLAEGFSTAATEALILGVPVCTVEVSGMKEMLGFKNEYGIVTENTEEALYLGIKRLLDDKELFKHYQRQAAIRGRRFLAKKTVESVENLLSDI